MSKNAKAGNSPSPSKSPKKGFDENRGRLHPAWRIGWMEMRDPFGWHIVDAAQLDDIRQKLTNFERMTWNEILGRTNHLVAVGRLCKDARDRLTELHLDDIDELVSLRLTGVQRVWGILEHNVVILLWWDPEHLVCPSLLRNT